MEGKTKPLYIYHTKFLPFCHLNCIQLLRSAWRQDSSVGDYHLSRREWFTPFATARKRYINLSLESSTTQDLQRARNCIDSNKLRQSPVTEGIPRITDQQDGLSPCRTTLARCVSPSLVKSLLAIDEPAGAQSMGLKLTYSCRQCRFLDDSDACGCYRDDLQTY
ncbi:hypothetical protein L218DRAFT_694985 [Marasmius fiardii PR-910]|nr:hypothetical protein L218DRAFT_694985 [Marasmius fiardii PR-910]